MVWIWHLISDFNGCFGDVRCIAAINLLQVRRNAASAITPAAQGGFVRSAVVRAGRSEGLLTARNDLFKALLAQPFDKAPLTTDAAPETGSVA